MKKEQDITPLLLGCKSDCRYLGILEENEWVNNELTGYDHLSNIPLKKVKKLLLAYRYVNFLFYNMYNQQLILDYNLFIRFLPQSLFVGVEELVERNDKLTIQSAKWIDEFNKQLEENNNLTLAHYVILPKTSINKIIFSVKNYFNKDMLNYVMNFLRSIHSYASMGDHSNFTKLDSIELLFTHILHYYEIEWLYIYHCLFEIGNFQCHFYI